MGIALRSLVPSLLARKAFWRTLVAVCAIAFVLIGTTALVSHGHAPGPGTHDGCSLCLTTHAVIAVVIAVTLFSQKSTARAFARWTPTPMRQAAECPYWNRPPPILRSFS